MLYAGFSSNLAEIQLFIYLLYVDDRYEITGGPFGATPYS